MQADRIRDYANRVYVEPARAQGQREVTIRAGDVHKQMRLSDQMPAVCGALGSNKFQEEYRVRRVSVDGPLNGPNCQLTFEILE